MRNLAGAGGVKTDNTSTMTIESESTSDTDLVARARSGDTLPLARSSVGIQNGGTASGGGDQWLGLTTLPTSPRRPL